MASRPDPPLHTGLAAADLPERVERLVALGRFEEAQAEAETTDPEQPAGRLARASVALARGEYLLALDLTGGGRPAERRLRALSLAALGRYEEGLGVLDEGGEDRLLRAQLHLEAGEARQAAVLLASARREEAAQAPREDFLRGAIAVLEKAPARALAPLRACRDQARRLGAASWLGRSWAWLGEAHADLGNRWRALRSATHALDLARSGRIEASAAAGVYYRVFLVYGMFGHGTRAAAALDEGHHRIIQIATQLEQREYREGFFLDNPEVQRLVGAWKGAASWGSEVPR